jgi:hypothetical protein
MDDERLFEMIEACVASAVKALENDEPLHPFAMVLDADGTSRHVGDGSEDHQKRYEKLLEALRIEARKKEIMAAALLARVTIPSGYAPAVPEGIRIHVEERASSGEKLAARFLYIPYQLYRTEEEAKIAVRLHNPIPVGFPSEIFL